MYVIGTVIVPIDLLIINNLSDTVKRNTNGTRSNLAKIANTLLTQQLLLYDISLHITNTYMNQ